jgi:ATP-binding protein involved in chromosome partitioning
MLTNEKVLEVLSTVIYPGFKKSIVEFNFVKDIVIENEAVNVLIDITSSAPEVEEQLKNEVTTKLELAGAKTINISIRKPEMPREKSNTRSGKNMVPHIKNFVMVSSGKGGVGKSTTTVNLAIATAMQGKRVGILDADIYGPNVPRMLGLVGVKPEVTGQQVLPLEAYGIEAMSMGALLEEGQSLIWRGSMIMKVIEQLLRDISWSELDVLFIDMPPGTGDAQLTLAQSVPVTAGITVTTPQQVSIDDSIRSLDMFKKLHIPIAGLVENMSGFICPETNKEYDIFGKGTAEKVAKDFQTEVLAQVPIEPAIREGGDSGKPVVFHNPDSETAKRYLNAADKLWKFIEEVNSKGGASNDMIQPTTNGVSACSSGSGSCGCS